MSIKVRSRDRVAFGTGTVDLGAVEQIVEEAQTRAIANAVVWAREHILDGELTMGEAVERALDAIGEEGPGLVHPHRVGELAAFRRFELAAFLNRLRTLRTRSGAEAE